MSSAILLGGVLVWSVETQTASVVLPCEAMKPGTKSISWNHAGPGGYAMASDPLHLASAGAAQSMVHVSNSSWLLATANGGIWKTSDLHQKRPHWQQKLDGQPVSCTSISAMESLGQTILAGCGAATSAEMGYDWMVANGGDWGGVMISHDGGENWRMTGFPANYFVTAFVLVSKTTFLVAARAHFHNKNDGGIWASHDAGATWKRTFKKPVYDLVRTSSGAVLAALPWVADEESIYLSQSGGTTAGGWEPAAHGISWDGRTPFYPTFTLSGDKRLFIGALTVNPGKLSDTASAIYHIDISSLLQQNSGKDGAADWVRVEGDPTGDHLDRDGMPKDRMALLVNPQDPSMLFVAGK